MSLLVLLEVKNEGIPKLFGQYLMKRSEWEPIKKYLKSDLDLIIIDEELSSEKIFVNKNTLKYFEDNNDKHIEAFKILHKNCFFNFDLLSFFQNSIGKSKNDTIFTMDEDDSDIGYYLNSKKSTPEFSDLDDEKIKKIIIETKKTVNLFKSPNND